MRLSPAMCLFERNGPGDSRRGLAIWIGSPFCTARRSRTEMGKWTRARKHIAYRGPVVEAGSLGLLRSSSGMEPGGHTAAVDDVRPGSRSQTRSLPRRTRDLRTGSVATCGVEVGNRWGRNRTQ